MPNLVEPMADATMAPPAPEQMAPPAPEAMPPAPEDEGTPPPPALMKIPAFQALFAGSPPAVSYNLEDKSDREERRIAEENADYLSEAGFRTYRTLDKERGVIYNALHVHPDDLLAADKAGTLNKLAPDFDAVNHAVGKSGLSNPLFHAGDPPAGPAASRSGAIAPQSATQQAIADRISGAPQSLPSPQNIVAPASAGAQKRITSARMSNMKPSAPTGGPAPGGGALLASILKPVV